MTPNVTPNLGNTGALRASSRSRAASSPATRAPRTSFSPRRASTSARTVSSRWGQASDLLWARLTASCARPAFSIEHKARRASRARACTTGTTAARLARAPKVCPSTRGFTSSIRTSTHPFLVRLRSGASAARSIAAHPSAVKAMTRPSPSVRYVPTSDLK